MREIKFRAVFEDDVIIYFDMDEAIKNRIGFSTDGIKVIEQSTGLLDKNGKEIYEGDRLEYDGEKCPHCKKLIYNDHKLYTIKWNTKDATFECINDENFMSPYIWSRDMKIIGNIHENPDLLQGT